VQLVSPSLIVRLPDVRMIAFAISLSRAARLRWREAVGISGTSG
jgi:hypothetical protein